MTFTESFFAIFDKLMEQIGVAVDWTAQNVVPYATDLGLRVVKFDTFKHIGGLILCIIALIVTILIFKKVYPSFKKDEISDIPIIFSTFAIVISIFAGSHHTVEIAKNIIVPEITVIEMMQDIINSNTNN